jgi:hypothetical protein
VGCFVVQEGTALPLRCGYPEPAPAP